MPFFPNAVRKEVTRHPAGAPAGQGGRFAPSGDGAASEVRPSVDWDGQQQDFDPSDFVTSRAKVTREWVPLSGLEVTSTSRSSQRFDSVEALPPASLRATPKGLVVMDGNHRLAYWRSKGYTHVPALVYTESAD